MIIDTDQLRRTAQHVRAALPDVLRDEPDAGKRYEWVILWDNPERLLDLVDEVALLLLDIEKSLDRR